MSRILIKKYASYKENVVSNIENNILPYIGKMQLETGELLENVITKKSNKQ